MKSQELRSKGYIVSECPRSEVREFIETHHYSHNINGVKSSYCFRLDKDGTMLGAMLFGQMATRGQWEPYGSSEKSVLELRRLVLLDEAPRNSESYFISRALKWLKRNTEVETIVSYADPAFGHQGVVYRASNFTFAGVTAPTKVVVFEGREYHDRALRTKYKGDYKPFAKRLREAVEDGRAEFQVRPPKNIYIYRFKEVDRG